MSVPEPILELGYLSAYDALPTAYLRSPSEFWALYSAARDPALAWYIQMCFMTGQRQRAECPFRWHQGHLSDGRGYLVIEYPEPPLVEIDEQAFSEGDYPPEEMRLYPYFSALLPGVHSHEAACYALGQSPVDGITTLRLCRSAAHYNLGRGSAPELTPFLESLLKAEDLPLLEATVRHPHHLDSEDRHLLGYEEPEGQFPV